MRPTLLNFRSPQERTANFHRVVTDKKGAPLDMKHVQTNSMGSNFSKEIRFKDAKMYDNGSG